MQFFSIYFIQYIYFTFISLNKMASKKFYNSTLCAVKNAILEEWYGHFESSHRNLSTMNKMLVNIAIIHHFYYFFLQQSIFNIVYIFYLSSFPFFIYILEILHYIGYLSFPFLFADFLFFPFFCHYLSDFIYIKYFK